MTDRDEKMGDATTTEQPETVIEETSGAPPDGAAVALAAEMEATLRQELAAAQAKANEYLDGWQRARAELSNYRKRVEREQAEFGKYANAALIARLLPILDDLQRAFQTLPADLRGLTWIEGIALIERKLNAILESEGLAPIEAVGQPFDPTIHQAVMQEETDQHEEGTVIAEFQKGYKLNDRVLRPSYVKVAKKPTPQPTSDDARSSDKDSASTTQPGPHERASEQAAKE